MRNNLLLLHFFSIFLNPQRVTLTYSAMTDGPIDVQLRWANLRAREHHVKGPKKSPRKMVLRRLILRKAEEAKRTTTWAPYRVQCPCLQCQNQPRWILPNFPSVDMGTLSKTVGFSLYPSHWVQWQCQPNFSLRLTKIAILRPSISIAMPSGERTKNVVKIECNQTEHTF